MDRLVHIVDDDDASRTALGFLLRNLGYEARIYASGREFLDRNDDDRGCVLLDVHMPGMDGFEVLAEMERRQVKLPIIMLTGDGDVPLAIRAMRHGAVDFLEKLCGPDALVAAIEHASQLMELDREGGRSRADATEKLSALTPREVQILQCLQEGMANKLIARQLNLSPRTVETYRANMMTKLGVSRLSHALHIARDANLARIGPDDFYPGKAIP